MNGRVEAVNEAMQEQLGGWEPDNATDTMEMLQSLPGLFEGHSQVLTGMADKLGEHAVDPQVTEELREAAASLDGHREQFENLLRTFRMVHENDLARLENPRPGESDWDVTQN